VPYTNHVILFSSLVSITSYLSSTLFSFSFSFLHVPQFIDNSCSKISRYQWRYEHITRLRDTQGKHTVAVKYVGCASGQVDSFVCVCAILSNHSLSYHSHTHSLTHPLLPNSPYSFLPSLPSFLPRSLSP
jgi:hypothetical protein